MNDRFTHLGVVPESPEHVAREEFPDMARAEWAEAKEAYRKAHGRMASLLKLLHDPGMVTVYGRTTGSLYEAKQLRDDVDRMVVALDHIVSTAKSIREEKP